jgi:hypothetical protein
LATTLLIACLVMACVIVMGWWDDKRDARTDDEKFVAEQVMHVHQLLDWAHRCKSNDLIVQSALIESIRCMMLVDKVGAGRKRSLSEVEERIAKVCADLYIDAFGTGELKSFCKLQAIAPTIDEASGQWCMPNPYKDLNTDEVELTH